jgi:hypothetical protein
MPFAAAAPAVVCASPQTSKQPSSTQWEGDQVEVQKTYPYIQMGLNIRFLRHVAATHSAKVVKRELTVLKGNLQKLKFVVSLASLSSSRDIETEKALAALKDEDKLGALAPNVVSLAVDLEQVIFAEGITKFVYVLPERRFQSEYLLSAPQKLLKDGSYLKLDPIAQSDIAAAGRCIAFGEATAAAFHILRATESVLKSYYFLHKKTKRLKKPMWGPMTQELRAKKTARPSESLLGALDVVRTSYRNPTQHPEATYEIHAAQDLMGVCLDLVGKMAAEL